MRLASDTTQIAAAAEWRLIGLLLERPRPGWHEEAATLSAEVRDAALRAAAAAARGVSEGDYLRLLGPGGLVSPREVTYRPFADPGRLLAELASVYDAFGFHPRVEDPMDHIAVEAAFVGYLLLKEAFAAACGDRAGVSTTAKARRNFVETHLATLANAFAQRVGNVDASYLRSLGRLLAARLPARRTDQPLPSAAPVDVCGACELGAAD
ncbi:MAG TPA: molecular chaperone TorD family protein [Candidatus Margulisiibacteriota bacterium]|nr:molecular chaperone TorD family protein [Candidatus Margulisiibacteriota bacterium]